MTASHEPGMAGRLAGRRAIITGAASGIGQATASKLAAEGAQVGLIDVNGKRVRQAAEALPSGQALAICAEVTDEAQIADGVARAAAEFGGLDVVVVNAGVQLFGQDARAHELELGTWQRTINVNLTGAFLTSKYGIDAMLGSGCGSLILTGSPTGLRGRALGFDAYSASKAGIHGLVRVMAHDYASEHIRVNAVIPGFIDTPLVRAITEEEHELDQRLRDIPLGRAGRPEEVAAVIAFLASDESSYVTGSLYAVDGGVTAV